MNYKSGFTLAEVAELRHNIRHWSKGFTLAEVLITLGIIGVVAAITIPVLVAEYQNRAWDTADTVFNRKLEEALKTMNTQQTLAGYKNTEDFVNELSKHFKINKICKNDNLLSCFSDKIYWGVDKEEIDISTIKTSKNFGHEDWNTNIVGVQFANGTTSLIAYNPDCTQDPYSNQVTGTDCLAILYDTDGFKNHNTSGKDLRQNSNVIKLGKGCYKKVNDVCYANEPFIPAAINSTECEQAKADGAPIENCYYDNDFWAGAVKTCHDAGTRLPTSAEVGKLAAYIYNLPSVGEQEGIRTKRDDNKASEAGFKFTPGASFYVWSNLEETPYRSYGRHFNPTTSYWYYNSRYYHYVQTVCVVD